MCQRAGTSSNERLGTAVLLEAQLATEVYAFNVPQRSHIQVEMFRRSNLNVPKGQAHPQHLGTAELMQAHPGTNV